MKIRKILIAAALLLTFVQGFGHNVTPYSFRRLPGTDGLFSAYTMVQDSLGFLWVGTEMGLVKYDGFGCEYYRYADGDSTSLCQDHVNALLYCPEDACMIVGTDAGASVYEFVKDSFFQLRGCGYSHVKSLLRKGRTLWVGTVDGLLRFETPLTPTSVPVLQDGLPSDHIACARRIGDDLWFGAYDHIYCISPYGNIDIYRLPTERKLVLDIAPGPDGSLWVGTEQGLISYNPKDGTSRHYLENIPVKNFFYRDDSLWMGTDNGLYILNPDGQVEHFVHISGNSYSIPNNVVWCIFEDLEGDILLGTDHALSIAGIGDYLDWRSVSEVTGRNDGMDVSVMGTDSRGGFWLGGMNGLVRIDGGRFRHWYRTDAGPADMRLSHNKIRDIYDGGGGLWVVSDGGLDKISYQTGRVSHYSFKTESGERFTNWMYSIRTDTAGRLWVGTYDGLVMIPDGLPASGGKIVVDFCLSGATEPALSGNQIMDLALLEDRVVSVAGGRADCIDPADFSVVHIDALDDKDVSCAQEGDGCVWFGTAEGVFCLTSSWEVSKLQGYSLPVSALAVSGDRLFAMSGRSVSVYNMTAREWASYTPGMNPLFCGMDDGRGNVLLGTVDGYFIVDAELPVTQTAASSAAITALVLNNERVKVGAEYDGNVILGKNIVLTDRIVLGPRQNSFAVEFSSFNFDDSGIRFFYRLKGLDDEFQISSSNRATFINIPPGDYLFEVYPSGAEGTGTASLAITVRPFWYLTTIAFVFYVLAFVVAIFLVFWFMRLRHQLQIERIEREDALNVVKMKSEFISNVAHEFKSPMTIILGMLGRMLSKESDAIKTRELSAVQSNAEKMHLLLNQMLEYNENGGTELFIPAAVSLQELAGEVYESFVPAFEEKGINCRFTSDEIGYIFMLDRVRMSSVFQNLLSNALKFTPSGGTVLMSVKIAGETSDLIYAEVKVEDTGCGIREDELPFLFSQYYKAPSNQQYNTNGSGIGLYLTRKIVQMHKGTIGVTSAPGRGTSFTVRLSTMKADSFVINSPAAEHYSLHSLSRVWQHERKPILLLVEDNADIRDFITASLGDDYTFFTASEGAEGLEILSREKIDLVITDIAMPGMDGLTMARSVRSSVKTAFLPIIVLTGKNDLDTQLRSLENADAFIAKPFNLNYLNDRIIQLLIKHEQYLENIRKQQMLSPEEVAPVQSPDEKFLQEIVDIVNEHIADPDFSPSVLCDRSHYGSKQIYRKIKQLTGMGTVEFIRDTRLQKAAMYLSQKKLSVTEVMYLVGFTTPSYFAKCFKEKYGVPPSDY